MCRGNIRVDGTDHTSLAMLALGAVEPHGLLILDVDGVGQNVGSGAETGVGGHVAREEGVCLVLDHVLNGDTGLVKGRLSDGVVLSSLSVTAKLGFRVMDIYLCVELELDQVTRLCLDVVWREDEGSVGSADLDNVCVDHSRRSHASSNSSSQTASCRRHRRLCRREARKGSNHDRS